jgi:HK97 family phage portal protein
MSILENIGRFFALEPMAPEPRPLQTRESATLEDFALRVLGNRGNRIYQKPTIRQALEVPAVLNAVTKISNITGSLSMEVLRNGVPLDERPPVIRRPNPLTTPRDFFRDVAYSMAVRGEAWLWIAKRDRSDDSALALVPINPVEIFLEDRNDGRPPAIRWGDRYMRREDMIQITYLREPGAARGVGPLQLCGAAVSVAVESQQWAANFYAEGGHPSVVIKHANELDPSIGEDGLSEADRLRQQWVDRPNNVPRIIDQNIEDVAYHAPNESAAQMLSARMYQNGEVANMFGIPGPLLEYSAQGSSLTYERITDLTRQFAELCLIPYYLVPIEQAMSDLLTRSTIARFDTEGLLRADVKTQYEVATLGFEKGIIDRDEARSIVSMVPNLEVQPVPFSPPAAIPNVVSFQERSSGDCIKCGKHLADVAPPGWRTRCPRCKTVNENLQERAIAAPAPPPVVTPVILNEVAAPDMSGVGEALAAMAERPQTPTNVSITSQPDETLLAAITELRERIDKPRVRRIERDEDGRMIRLLEESA